MKIILLIYTIYTWIILILSFVFHFLLAAMVIPFFTNKAQIHQKMSKPILFLGFFLCGIRVKVEGLENFKHSELKNFLIMSNHQSLLDILVYSMLVPQYFSFISKKEVAKVPILGWDLKIQKHILIDRENPRKALATLNELKDLVAKNRSFLVFPEGTRSADGQIGTFKSGFFKLALETGTPIIPAYLNGTNKVIKKKSLLIHPGKITVNFAPPIFVPKAQTTRIAKSEILALSEKVRNIILKL
jgi:1-acyl-sn-glycerol-3-phosphate acyltransferase